MYLYSTRDEILSLQRSGKWDVRREKGVEREDMSRKPRKTHSYSMSRRIASPRKSIFRKLSSSSSSTTSPQLKNGSKNHNHKIVLCVVSVFALQLRNPNTTLSLSLSLFHCHIGCVTIYSSRVEQPSVIIIMRDDNQRDYRRQEI